MDVNDNASFLNERVTLQTIASKLAPTVQFSSVSPVQFQSSFNPVQSSRSG